MLLTSEKQELYKNAKICRICNETFQDKYPKDKKCCKAIDHFPYTSKYRADAHSIYNLKHYIPK